VGCDIHMFIEYSQFEGHWSPFSGEIYGDRDYELFGLLAGVRGEASAVIAPRGLPDNLGWVARNKAYLSITPDKEYHGEEGWVSETQAKVWIKNGCSRFFSDSHHGEIAHPDWHSHSWMTNKEFKSVLKKISKRGYFATYKAIVATMDAFEKDGIKVRLVFWFDN